MPKDVVRTTLDIPAPIYRKLKEQAAHQDCSVRDLLLHGIEGILLNPQRPRRKPVKFPLIDSEGPKVELSSERLMNSLNFLIPMFGWRSYRGATPGVGADLATTQRRRRVETGDI